MRSNRGLGRLGAIVLALGFFISQALAQQDDAGLGENDWPCKHKYRPTLVAASVWAGPALPDGAGAWRDDAALRALVERIASPETSPKQGVEEIERFAATLAADRAETLTLLFAGLLDEINAYRRFAVDGVWEFAAKHRLVARVLAETEAAYLAVPYDGGAASEAERKRLEVERFWQQRAFDDFEDEARYLCHRLVYLEGKLGALARAIAGRLEP